MTVTWGRKATNCPLSPTVRLRVGKARSSQLRNDQFCCSTADDSPRSLIRRVGCREAGLSIPRQKGGEAGAHPLLFMGSPETCGLCFSSLVTAFQYVCLSPRTSTAPVPDGGEPEVDIHFRVHSLKTSEQMWDRVWPRPSRAPQLLHSLCLPMPARCQVQSQASAL